MKENTKFLWMYVGILLSFALILIIFAGLSRNSNVDRAHGLKADLSELSQKNTELENKIKELNKNLDEGTKANEELKKENEALIAEAQKRTDTDKALMDALNAYNSRNYTKCSQIISTIDRQTLTETQLYIYNKLV